MRILNQINYCKIFPQRDKTCSFLALLQKIQKVFHECKWQAALTYSTVNEPDGEANRNFGSSDN